MGKKMKEENKDGIENLAFENEEIVTSKDATEIEFFEDLPEPDLNKVQLCMKKSHNLASNWLKNNKKYVKSGKKILIIGLSSAYFIWATVNYVQSGKDLEWCDGYGLLLILVILTILNLTYSHLLKPICWPKISSNKSIKTQMDTVLKWYRWIMAKPLINILIYVSVFLSIFIFLLVDTSEDRRRLISFLGLILLVIVSVIFSNNPSRINWRSVIWGLSLQFLFGLVILRWEVGRQIFQCLGDKVKTFLSYTDLGSSFVYGNLIEEGIFMFKVLSVIFFFSFFTSMLFHLGCMQWLISRIGWFLQVTIGTTPCESMNAAANIFLGQTEAPLMIKPFLPTMTPSELHCVMAGGMATIAGSVLAAYINAFNIDAAHLLSASVMSAPAALAASKLLYPETKKNKNTIETIEQVNEEDKAANLLDAASQGAASAVILVANIGGILIAVIAFIAFINGILSWACELIGFENVTIELVLGKIFVPLAGLMGVENKDLELVGQLLGLKSFVNEFVAYSKLKDISDMLSPRSKTIATYALCGFSNPASIGIQIAGFSTLAPERRQDFSRCAIRAYCAGSLACFMTACIAGTLIQSQ